MDPSTRLISGAVSADALGAAPPPAEADADAFLVGRARDGDVAAFESLVRRHERWVFSMVLRMVGNRHEAEDVAQDIFLKAYCGLPSFRGTARFSTWLHTIATNQT